MIDALLIDLDGVLRIWSPENNRRAERAAGLPDGAILRVAFGQDLLPLAITGRISDNEWRAMVADRLRAAFPDADAAQAVRGWSASSGEIDQAVLEIVRMCRQTVQVVLITNATSRLPRDLEQLALVNQFDHIINSSAVGVAKPHPAIFAAALKAAGVAARATLFVDDSPGHVAAAVQLGMLGHVYQGIAQLKQVLAQHALP